MVTTKKWLSCLILGLVYINVVHSGLSCLSNPCVNGICIDDINSTYSCYCIDGYTGIQCQTNWDECWSYPCLNGGTCIDGIASYNCSCDEGFIGENCETNYDECESNPCLNNATCIDMNNGYLCSCLPGFLGEHCETDVAVCNSSEETRCFHGGQCVEGPGYKYYCKCLPGWTGAKCETPVDECASNPCQNGGACIDLHADYLCACAFGYMGKSCEIHMEFCKMNDCSNNAICLVEDSINICYCVPDYHGEKCEMQYDECQLGPRCLNGGTCIDGIDNFTCSCPPSLTGVLCECLVLGNGSLDCNYVSPSPYPSSESTTLYKSSFSTNSIITSTIPNTENILESSTGRTSKEVTVTDKFSESSQDNLYTAKHVDKDFETSTYDSTRFISADDLPVTILLPNQSFSMSTEISTVYHVPSSAFDYKTTVFDVTDKCDKKSRTTTVASMESVSDPLPSTSTEYLLEDTTTISSLQKTEIVIIKDMQNNTDDQTKSIDISTENTQPTTPLDLITGQLFTESPSQASNITLTPYITTLSELTTRLEELTTGFSTYVPQGCPDEYCNNMGSCIQTPQGNKCLCEFNRHGEYCEKYLTIRNAAFGGNSYVAHKILNETSLHITFIAKTLTSDGQIMFVDISKGIYMQLVMMSGLLKFKFSCGHQTMLLTELKTFVNRGYNMKIETLLDLGLDKQHCNATLRLNDTVAMSGGQIAKIDSLSQTIMLYLGNVPKNVTEYVEASSKPFVGCIQDLIVNSKMRRIHGDAFEAVEIRECSSLSCLSNPCRNGGSCIDKGENFTCACAKGYLGDHCQKSVCEHNPCQNGGSCIQHPATGFMCLCTYGSHGMFCEYSLEITRPSLAPIIGGISSYVVYPLTAAVNSEKFDLKFRFHSVDMDQIALLAFIGLAGRHDSKSQHLAITFVKGYIMLTWNMGHGARRIFTPRPLSERRVAGHTVRVGRRGRTAWLSVDSRFNVSGNAPGPTTTMNVVPLLFIGGHPSTNFEQLPHDLPLHAGWRGCVWEAAGALAGAGGGAVAGRAVGQCGVTQCSAATCHAPRGVCVHHPATYGCICNEGAFGPTCGLAQNPCDTGVTKCQGYCVLSTSQDSECDCPYGTTGKHCDKEMYPGIVQLRGIRSYLKLIEVPISSVSLSLEVHVKPLKARGLLAFARTPNFHVALSMQGGIVEFRWTEGASGLTSVVSSSVVAAPGSWHRVKAGRYGSRLYAWVDGALATRSMPAHTYPHTNHNASIVIGGDADLSTLPYEVMSGPPESFMGCIKNVHVNNVPIPLVKENIKGGVNILPCEGEAIRLEETNRCVMPGSRCRREAHCSAKDCAKPRGYCRNNQCICLHGFTGTNCTESINITIPEFNGESLMLVENQRQLEDQPSSFGNQMANSIQYKDIVLNFTTAEPNGLLLWAKEEENRFGMGLFDGFLKIIWFKSTKNNDKLATVESVNVSSNMDGIHERSLPQAGFAADAEWHKIRVSVDIKNVSVTFDDNLVFVEEPGFTYEEYFNAKIYIGGVPVEDEAHIDKYFTQNFKGCINNIQAREDSQIGNYSLFYSENINTCQLFH